jgi:hypothetical protein
MSTETQQPGLSNLSVDESEEDLTRICWTQLLRAESSEHVEPLLLPPEPDDFDIEKLFSILEAGLSTDGSDSAVVNSQHRHATDERQPPDLLPTEPKG